jgi:hypothetical protein
MAGWGKYLNISTSWMMAGVLGCLLFSQVSCSGCRQRAAQGGPDPSPVVFKGYSVSPTPREPPARTPTFASKETEKNTRPVTAAPVPDKPSQIQETAKQNSNTEAPALSNRNEVTENFPPPIFDSAATGPDLAAIPSFVEQNKFSQAPVFIPSGAPPINSNNHFVPNNSPPVSPPAAAEKSSPFNAPAFPVASASNNHSTNNSIVAPPSGNGNPGPGAPPSAPTIPLTSPAPPLPQAMMINVPTDTNNVATAPPALMQIPTESANVELEANGKLNLTGQNNTDTELTVAMAEGVLNSAPESAAMGGGFNYSDLALAFPEETSEARKTKISQGDKSYELNLPDTQERYKAEIPLTWVLWAVTSGDIHSAVLPDGTINPEEYAKLQFGEVEKPLNGSQDGRLVRVFSCGSSTAPTWNEAWASMYFNIIGTVPPPPTLADLCGQPSYRDYRISGDKISFDLPVTGRGALIFVTFNPVDWLKPEFQSAVGAKHIEGEPIPISNENLKATIEKGELIRAVGL